MPQVPRAVELQDAEWREGNDMALFHAYHVPTQR